jgi:hypothetical protein
MTNVAQFATAAHRSSPEALFPLPRAFSTPRTPYGRSIRRRERARIGALSHVSGMALQQCSRITAVVGQGCEGANTASAESWPSTLSVWTVRSACCSGQADYQCPRKYVIRLLCDEAIAFRSLVVRA